MGVDYYSCKCCGEATVEYDIRCCENNHRVCDYCLGENITTDEYGYVLASSCPVCAEEAEQAEIASKRRFIKPFYLLVKNDRVATGIIRSLSAAKAQKTLHGGMILKFTEAEEVPYAKGKD